MVVVDIVCFLSLEWVLCGLLVLIPFTHYIFHHHPHHHLFFFFFHLLFVLLLLLVLLFLLCLFLILLLVVLLVLLIWLVCYCFAFLCFVTDFFLFSFCFLPSEIQNSEIQKFRDLPRKWHLLKQLVSFLAWMLVLLAGLHLLSNSQELPAGSL